MGRKSTKENKNIYQLSRKAVSLTRETAAAQLAFISSDRIDALQLWVQKAIADGKISPPHDTVMPTGADASQSIMKGC